jgi:regulator of cell morphogenesis and NO signaling
MNINENQIIGEMVANDYRTATVFKKYGIDFCCNGNRTISDACEKKNLEIKNIMKDLESAVNQPANNLDFTTWQLDLLADYIVKKHHTYVAQRTSEIKPFLEKVCRVHGQHHPELFQINEQFTISSEELSMHMKKEEMILFPYVHKLVSAKQNGIKLKEPHFGTVRNPIQLMMQEHSTEGDRFRKIAELSNDYTPPPEACNTYKVTFALLKEFEDDLHMHIHLENNILFPKAIEMENELRYASV